MTKIYFCGSIRAGRADAELYGEIINLLRQHGQVLTEHIGLDEPWNAPHLAGFPLGQSSLEKDKIIFQTDVCWLREADVVVAEVTQPSLGVGFELGLAWQLGKRVLCLFRPAATAAALSAMVRGADNGTQFSVLNYSDVHELSQVFTDLFKQIHE